MELSLLYIVCILLTVLSAIDPTDSDVSCPTSRRLLLFKGLKARVGEKKSHRISSSSKSSPPKYARSGDTHGLTVFLRPKISNELGHKLRSFTHLLTSKLYTNEEKALIKRSQLHDKKKRLKNKSSTSPKLTTAADTQELISMNDNELNRCRALLLTDSTTHEEKKARKEKKDKSIKPTLSSRVQTATTQAAKNLKKKLAAAVKSSLAINEQKGRVTKRNTEAVFSEKKTMDSRAQKNASPKVSSALPSPPISNTKTRGEKSPPITIKNKSPNLFGINEDGVDEKNNSVVDRAYHFVKTMFQLSDDLLDGNYTQEQDRIINIVNDPQQHYHHSRKLLSVKDLFDHSLFAGANVRKRRLLSAKATKHSASSKTSHSKEKKSKLATKGDANKPKVGWAYRYRISRYLDAQKMKRTGNKNKLAGGGKTKPLQKQSDSKQKQKESNASKNNKIPKRKLLQYHDENNIKDYDEISDPDLVNTVSIVQTFVPKRQLLASKVKVKENDEDDDDLEKSEARRRMKSFEELTDPVAIIDSYDRGLYKPRVGWQFRYRVSRYIDSLRANIREDQQRLKLGLQAIKRKTPQELSGRRKRVLDKPFAPDFEELKKQEEASIAAQENKPNVGWRYRYRISKMKEAQERGDYIDDEEERRLARLEQKTKHSSHSQSRVNDEDVEGHSDLDPELRKINDEGRRVGWGYRYRIRRKLDDLKQQQAENGIPFDLASLSGKREKKAVDSKVKTTEKKTNEAEESKSEEKKKSVGWEYRYRVSKMREAQKQEKSKVASTKKQEPLPIDKQLDPELARLKPEERAVGWEYRYRIRRKLDSLKSAVQHESNSGKRTKKSSKGKGQEKIIKQVEESIEKILNIDDIDETPFMEYFRRSSSYVLFGLLPTAKKSICLLPLPVNFVFCNEQDTDSVTAEKAQQIPKKKLRTKKEQRAKQFIHSRPTKLGAEDKATERRVDEAMRKLYKTPSLPPPQTSPTILKAEKSQKKKRVSSSKRSDDSGHTKHIIAEDHPVKKQIGVESKKQKNKKQFQLLGQEVKAKHKHTSSPVVEVPKTTAAPPPPLRSISEVIQQEAATILAVKRKSTRTPEEIQEETNEANESIRERTKLKATTTPEPSIDSTTSGEEDNDAVVGTDRLDSEVSKQRVPDKSDL